MNVYWTEAAGLFDHQFFFLKEKKSKIKIKFQI